MVYREEIITENLRGKPCTYFDKYGEPVESKDDAVLAVYDEPYSVISCKYIPISKNRKATLRELRNAVCIFQYLNQGVTEKDIRVWIRGKLKNATHSVSASDIGRVVREAFGSFEFPPQTKRTRWLRFWTNDKIENAKYIYGDKSKEFYEVLVTERRKFSTHCYNYTPAKRALDRFLDAIEYVRQHYRYVSVEMVCEHLDISEDHFYYMRNKVNELVNFEILHGKSVESRERILNAGELVNKEDNKIITKSRIHKKSIQIKKPVTRPTINKHWKHVEGYFQELDNMLKN